jgi:hypothetical protein
MHPAKPLCMAKHNETRKTVMLKRAYRKICFDLILSRYSILSIVLRMVYTTKTQTREV